MRRVRVAVKGPDAGRRLDALLQSRLPEALGQPLSRSAVRRLVMAGAVRVDGRILRRPGHPLRAGQAIDAQVDVERLDLRRDVTFAVGAGTVLYEDAWLIAVDKPSGLSTVPTADPQRTHLVGAVEAYLAPPRRGEGRAAAVGVHQRLDRETSGVVLFTKDPAANPGLARAFAAREIQKTYHAVVRRPAVLPARTWRNEARVGGQGAETSFRRLQVFERALLVEARPRTGRKHQIRIHLADEGMPILGDERYGPRGTASRLMLHAAVLQLAHPVTGAALRIESPYPEDFRRILADTSRHLR